MSRQKVAIVTGANKGIGFEIARNIGKQLHTVLACRNAELGEEAAAQLKSEGCDVRFLPLDIGNSESINNFKHLVQSEYPGGVDVLVNNAAIAFKGADPTPFGQQAAPTLKVNLFGTVELTRAVEPMLRDGGRISTVASVSGQLRNYSPEICALLRGGGTSTQEILDLGDRYIDLAQKGQHNQAGFPSSNYGVSKALVIAWTRVLAKELSTRKILVNCCCPGYCATDMSSHRGNKSAAQGADTPTMLALLPDGSPSGQFWSDRKVVDW